MMKKWWWKALINHTGERYGKLTIIGCEKINGMIKQKCLCDCGNIAYVRYSRLTSGHKKSCGCLRHKYNIENKRLFNCWYGMKGRCDSSNRKDSKYYHDKGISYCDEWRIYENFQKWALENGYSDELTLDRINGDLPYCPENCRWITIEEQQRNKSNCIYFTHNGETKTISEWAREFGINRSTLYDRIYKLGYSFEEAIFKSRGSQKSNVYIKYKEKLYTQAEFARLVKCTPTWVSTLRRRGLSGEEIMERMKNHDRN